MIQNNFDVRQKISSLIAFTFIILISLVLSWYSIRTSDEILANMPNSKVMSIDRRMQDENTQENIEVRNMIERDGASNDKEMPD